MPTYFRTRGGAVPRRACATFQAPPGSSRTCEGAGRRGACFGSVSFEAVGRNERSNKVVGLGEATTSSPRCLNLGLHIRVLLLRDPRSSDGSRTGAALSLSGSRRSRRPSRTTVPPPPKKNPGPLPASPAAGLLGATRRCRHDYSPQKEAAASRRRPRQRAAAARTAAPGASPRRGCRRGRRRHGCGRRRPRP